MISLLKAKIAAQAVVNEYYASDGSKTIDEILTEFGYINTVDRTNIKAAIIAKYPSIPVEPEPEQV